jgi:hypothetical protein
VIGGSIGTARIVHRRVVIGGSIGTARIVHRRVVIGLLAIPLDVGAGGAGDRPREDRAHAMEGSGSHLHR